MFSGVVSADTPERGNLTLRSVKTKRHHISKQDNRVEIIRVSDLPQLEVRELKFPPAVHSHEVI